MSDDKNQIFTSERLGDALNELGQIAYEAGRIIDIAIYGGSCLMLVSNFRIATADVDAVAAEDQGFLDNAAQTIAARRGWPRDWLNDGVRTYLSPHVDVSSNTRCSAPIRARKRRGCGCSCRRWNICWQ
jgi:hypothetical protein